MKTELPPPSYEPVRHILTSPALDTRYTEPADPPVREVQSAIEIGAPAEEVWAVLTDFAAYPEWNPFITRIDGEPRAGARLRVRIEPPGTGAIQFKPTVVTFAPTRELVWSHRFFVRGLFDREHAFRIEPRGSERSRLVEKARFSGLLVPMFARVLDTVELGFDLMNAVLKARAEDADRAHRVAA